MGTNDFSMSTWLKMGSVQNSFPTLISKGGGSNTDEEDLDNVQRQQVKVLCVKWYIGIIKVSNVLSITNNSWYHVAITVQRNGNINFYIDGVNVGTRDIQSMDGTDIASTRALTIGSFQSTSSTYFKGTIDDTRLYNVALSPASRHFSYTICIV